MARLHPLDVVGDLKIQPISLRWYRSKTLARKRPSRSCGTRSANLPTRVTKRYPSRSAASVHATQSDPFALCLFLRSPARETLGHGEHHDPILFCRICAGSFLQNI